MLDIEGLSAGYDGRAVIHDIGLHIGPGEIVALIGANGAGKSTLARTLSGLLPTLSGSIRFSGRDITRMAPSERVRMGLIHVPEGRQVFAGLTVAENLELGTYASQHLAGPAFRDRVQAVYRQFPVLQERAGSYAGNLSGGQQQMLAIARGMMGQPKLLILDEPSLGLSPSLVAEVFGLIGRLRSQGLAILLSEQNARMSLAIADRGYVIENGRVTFSGDAGDLLRSDDIAARYLGLDGVAQPSRLDENLSARLIETIRGAARRGQNPAST
jgi:branched-chain amino acid transport system ATP-binding protein